MSKIPDVCFECEHMRGPAGEGCVANQRVLCAEIRELRKGHHPLEIGKYSISVHPAGGFWIEHESGEGMQHRGDEIEKFLDELWKGF